MIVDNGKYYLYRHIRLDKDEPFYVGIGTKKKNTTYGRAKNKYKRNNLWNKIINKTKYTIEILLESDDYGFIKQKEIEFIALYGRINNNTGTLANLTDGGEGTQGYIPSKETLDKQSKRTKGRKDSVKTIEAKRAAGKNKIFSNITREKISNKKKNCAGHGKASFAKRVQHISSGKLFKSISQAAKEFKIRRNSLGVFLENNTTSDFKIVSEEYYCFILNKRNIKEERLKRISKTLKENEERKQKKLI